MEPPRGMMGGSARDFREAYNTRLSPRDEALFQEWALLANRGGDLEDYDLRGAWLGGYRGRPGQHGPDTFKKPNHPTFSSESRYSGPEARGGQWIESPDGSYVFVATPDNLRHRNLADLMTYFAEAEPGNRLVPPADLSGLRRER